MPLHECCVNTKWSALLRKARRKIQRIQTAVAYSSVVLLWYFLCSWYRQPGISAAKAILVNGFSEAEINLSIANLFVESTAQGQRAFIKCGVKASKERKCHRKPAWWGIQEVKLMMLHQTFSLVPSLTIVVLAILGPCFLHALYLSWRPGCLGPPAFNVLNSGWATWVQRPLKRPLDISWAKKRNGCCATSADEDLITKFWSTRTRIPTQNLLSGGRKCANLSFVSKLKFPKYI